jgi:hypothetical protein
MPRDDTLAQSFLQGLDRVALGRSAKQRSLWMPALAGSADGMATMEGGYVRGSGSKEGKKDTEFNSLMRFFQRECI